MSNLFVYGTLMHPAVMAATGGISSAALAATLQGYRRLPLRGERYPAMVECQGGSVPGMLYRDVPTAAWRRLDEYEGAMYRRDKVVVELADGRREGAECYLLRRRFCNLLGEGEWDYELFTTRHLRAFLRTLRKG